MKVATRADVFQVAAMARCTTGACLVNVGEGALVLLTRAVVNAQTKSYDSGVVAREAVTIASMIRDARGCGEAGTAERKKLARFWL